ncbi:MAG: M48 family metallopeptidase [Neisseria sp.]|nr:M48 family metallopeptidase [Neisseria sp.]
MKKRLIASALAACLALTGCESVAEMAGYDTNTLNQHAAKSYTEAMQQVRQEQKVDTSSRTARRIQTVFQRLKPHAERANTTGVPFNWEMTVIKSDELNAWAMPGGKMAFYTGLVETLKLSDDEIAAIVGHEMTHALEEHSKKDAGQKVITNTVLGVGGALLQSYTGVSADTVNLGSSLLSEFGIDKPFSRSQEYEADAGGLRLMAQAGYNPEAAITVWHKMNQHNDNNHVLNTILSTHPNNNDRIAAMQKLLPQVMPIYQANKKR